MLTNNLRADLVNLACAGNSNSNVTPELEEQDGVEASLEDYKTTAYQPPTVNLDSSIHGGPYASYVNTEIASINDELKSLLNFLATPQTNNDTSESASMKNFDKRTIAQYEN